ncbi:DUF6069 family protein [Streptosporangium longisporum]|uniref:Uncharacterized protein n=1 Tax=Streptosporangium longisporum TaxID=46187 RepID=A0ABN3XXR6_9ACTN
MTTSPGVDGQTRERGTRRRHGRVTVAAVVAATVAVATAANLVVYALGRAAGGTFRFTASGRAAEVDALTVAGFTVLPLLLGMTLVAVLSRRLRWIVPAALVVAPLLALVTVPVMTLPADLDTVSTVTLALCHVVLAPVAVAGLLAIRGLDRRPDASIGPGGPVGPGARS